MKKTTMYVCIKDCYEENTENLIYTKDTVYQLGVDACIIDELYESRDWGHDRGEISPEFYIYFKVLTP